MFSVFLFVAAFGPMIAEAMLSARQERALRATGAVEPGGDVHNTMRIAYPASFGAMILEALARERTFALPAAAGIVVFLLAKGLKYWAIATLGPRWTFRVLVPPGSTRTTSGPYRWLRHPNYVGVFGELVGMTLMAQAPISGIAATVAFGMLMLRRIRVEERALDRAGG
jgi:methyltransferase